MRNRKEHKLQCVCVKWFRLRYRRYHNLFWATPNGGTRLTLEAITLKKEGVLPGVSDLSLMVPNKDYHGYFIELKVGKNTQSENQKNFEKAVRSMGYKYDVIRDFDTFKERVTNYMNNR